MQFSGKLHPNQKTSISINKSIKIRQYRHCKPFRCDTFMLLIDIFKCPWCESMYLNNIAIFIYLEKLIIKIGSDLKLSWATVLAKSFTW